MPWQIIERRLGKAGNLKQQLSRKRKWDDLYGEGLWAIGYPFENRFILREEALEKIYHQSYEAHFNRCPEDLGELITLARQIRNPHATATGCVDLQVSAILAYLKKNRLHLKGDEVVDIGSWNGCASHAISIRLSPLHIKVIGNPKQTLEKFWQKKKCLAVWKADPLPHPIKSPL